MHIVSWLCWWYTALVRTRVCVCVRERERETGSHLSTSAVLIAVCVCERDTGSDLSTSAILIAACVCERERRSHHSRVYSPSEIVLIAACLQTHTSIITLSVKRFCSSFGLELMVKLRTLSTIFTLIFKAEAHDYGKGRYISDAVFGQSQCTVPVGQSEQTALVEGGTL